MFQLQSGATLSDLGRSRRRYLQAGLLGLGGLALSDLFRLQAQGAARPKNTAVILLFAHGGPSHLETYDLKPLAPAEIRGPYAPIPTNVPGIEISEQLPLHAKIADKFTLIRSVCHDEADHFAGHRRFLSGFGKLKPGTGYESYYPQVGAVVTRLGRSRVAGMPPALAVGGVVVNGPDYSAGISEGYWPGMYRVPIINGGLRDASLNVDPTRLADRQQLHQSFDRLRRDVDQSGVMDARDAFDRQAIEVLTSGKAREAFDLSQENQKLREQYGEGYGQEVLTARRLIEAGVSFVTVCDRGNGPGSAAHNWDDHAVNWDLLTAMNARLPRYDRIVATLIQDLYDRGLNDRVLLIVTGEFGRTPRLEFKDGRIGRDHWPGAMSILLSGGGMRMGQVIGATDQQGAAPSDRRLDPHDLLATIYRHLGIDYRQHVLDPFGRPVTLTNGQPIEELF
jgi:hypothetical protein